MESQLFSKLLSITTLSTTDPKFIFQLLNTEGWLHHIGDQKFYSLEDALGYRQKIENNPDVNHWLVRLRENDTLIGIISLIKRDYLEHPAVGFAFLPSCMTNGYAYEATKAVLKFLMVNQEFNEILGITVGENTISISLLKKLGFEFQKEIENKKLQVYRLSKDKFHITEITNCFFDCFTNKENTDPKLDTLKEICTPDVRIMNSNRSEVIYDLNSFLEPRKKILTDGTLVEFEEKEICEDTTINGNVAHRHCTYEKSGILNGARFKQNGYKLFQFKKLNQHWKISRLAWEDMGDKVR